MLFGALYCFERYPFLRQLQPKYLWERAKEQTRANSLVISSTIIFLKFDLFLVFYWRVLRAYSIRVL